MSEVYKSYPQGGTTAGNAAGDTLMADQGHRKELLTERRNSMI